MILDFLCGEGYNSFEFLPSHQQSFPDCQTAIILLAANKQQQPVILFWPSLSLPKKLVPFQVSTDLAALQQNGVASQDRVIKDLLYIRTLIAVTTAPSMATLLHISKWTSKFSSFGSVLTIRAKIMFSLKLGLAAGL